MCDKSARPKMSLLLFTTRARPLVSKSVDCVMVCDGMGRMLLDEPKCVPVARPGYNRMLMGRATNVQTYPVSFPSLARKRICLSAFPFYPSKD